MDLFKKANVVKATAFDYNAQRVFTLKNRRGIAKMLNRRSRRKLKQELNGKDQD